MDSFCSKIVEFFRDNDCEETIIALTLREIFLNDLIYISQTNKWQQYVSKKKEWSHFDIQKLVQSVPKVTTFYEKDLTNYLYSSKLQSIETFYIKKQIKAMVAHANDKWNTQLFVEKCKECFRIAS